MSAVACIVLVNWNSGHQLRSAIESINDKSAEFISRIIIVDNNSTDGSLVDASEFNNVTNIRLSENIGFGRACNAGAEECDTEFILFLNPDTNFKNDALGFAINFMTSDAGQDVGICGAQLIEANGLVARSCARLPTPMRLMSRALGIDQFFHCAGVSMREWNHATSRRVGQVMGAFFLVRRQLFQELRGFDSRFFVYYEEVDFSTRAAALGWASWYCAEAKVFHAKGGSSRQIKATRLFYSLRSRLQYARKHFGTLGSFGVALATWCVEPWLRVSAALLRRSPTEARETLQAYRMLLRWRWSKAAQ